MTDARTQTPNNMNFLAPQGFVFKIIKTPTLNYFVQNINVPGLSLDPAYQPNPFVQLPQTGDHILYDDLMINFKVDENLANYLEIHNWIRKLGFDKRYSQYKSLSDLDQNTGLGLRSDIVLMILTSSRNLNFEIHFRDAFPVSLSSMIFDTTLPDVQYIEAACTFRYDYFDILPVGSSIDETT